MSTGAPWTVRPQTWRAVLRVGRIVAATLFVATALFGALITPWLWMLVYAPVLGTLVGGAVALVDRDDRTRAPSRRTVVLAATAGVLAVPFGSALPALGGLGGVVVLVLLVVGSLVVVDWLDDEQPGTPGTDVTELGPVLGVLPTEELVHLWLATEDLLRSARDRGQAAEVRQLILDELARRDPEGVSEWLAAGGASPGPYLRNDRDLTG